MDYNPKVSLRKRYMAAEVACNELTPLFPRKLRFKKSQSALRRTIEKIKRARQTPLSQKRPTKYLRNEDETEEESTFECDHSSPPQQANVQRDVGKKSRAPAHPAATVAALLPELPRERVPDAESLPERVQDAAFLLPRERVQAAGSQHDLVQDARLQRVLEQDAIG